MHYIKQRSIILVNKDDHLLACLIICSLNQCSKTVVVVSGRISNAIFILIFCKAIAKIAFQLILLHMLARSHAKSYYGIFRPVLLHSLDEESLEQVLSSLEICLECRYKQRLAEPPRAAQENIFAEVYHIPDILSLVYVKTVEVNHLGECLYAYGQSFQLLFFHTFQNVNSLIQYFFGKDIAFI